MECELPSAQSTCLRSGRSGCSGQAARNPGGKEWGLPHQRVNTGGACKALHLVIPCAIPNFPQNQGPAASQALVAIRFWKRPVRRVSDRPWRNRVGPPVAGAFRRAPSSPPGRESVRRERTEERWHGEARGNRPGTRHEAMASRTSWTAASAFRTATIVFASAVETPNPHRYRYRLAAS